MTIAGSVHEFWESDMRQLQVIAKVLTNRHENTRTPSDALPASNSQTTWRAVTTGGKPVQPPDFNEEPALLTRLKIYQTSYNHQ